MAPIIDCWRGVLIHTILASIQPTYIALRVFLNRHYISNNSSIWLAINALTWIYLVTRVTIPFLTSPLRHLPSPPVKGFLRAHLDFNKGRPPMDNIIEACNKTPNDGVICVWLPLYLKAQLIVTRPDTLMELLNTHSYDWEKSESDRKLLERTLGRGLVNVEGQEHRAMRKVVSPAFSGRQIRDLVPLFYEKGLAFADALASAGEQASAKGVEMMSHMSRVTLDIIGAAAVGQDFNTIHDDDNRIAQLYAQITDVNRGPLILFVLVQIFLPRWLILRLRGTPYQRTAKAQIELRKEVRALMAAKKERYIEKGESERDIIATILRSGDFSDDYLVDQLLTFLAAGHDTTASALTWTTYLLSKHPKIQIRLRAECTEHLSNLSSSSIDATTFESRQMPYLTAVCNEVLRLYPTVPATARIAKKTSIISGHTIPVGTVAIMSMWQNNRDKQLWGEDALSFNPDRWLSGPNAAHGGATAPNALLTFLHGPRSCIGQTFAQIEMKVLLAVLVKRFRFELAMDEKDVDIGGFITLKPMKGMWLRLIDVERSEVKAARMA